MAVRLTGLEKSYGAVHAVQGVDLDIAPGEVVALLGPNGAGKSTTIDMLLGLARPDAGAATIFGNDPKRAVADGDVGAMLQSGTLLPDVTVGELVEAFAALHKRPLRVDQALGRAGIAELAKRQTRTLSGGEAQRVRFALAVVPDPDLLVLDEPTVAMDVEARRAFWQSMRELTSSGRTVLFATHYLEEADAYADRIVLMRGGRIVADGTSAAIKGQVSGRTITTVVPDPDRDLLAGLPGVATVEVRGEQVLLGCHDSDATLRALFAACPGARDVEVRSLDLEDTLIALTTEPREGGARSGSPSSLDPTGRQS